MNAIMVQSLSKERSLFKELLANVVLPRSVVLVVDEVCKLDNTGF